MEPTLTTNAKEEIVSPVLISYRRLIPEIISLVGRALVMAFVALLVMLAGCIGIIFLGTIVAVAAIVSGMIGFSSSFFIPIAIGVLAVLTWWHIFSAQMAMVRSILLQHHTRGYFESLRYVYRHWWRLLILVGSIQVLIAAGFMLFFIPGVIAAVYLGFALYSFMVETPRIRMALARSILIVHGRFWAVAGRYAFLLLTAMLLLAFSLILGLVLPPLFLGIPLAFFMVALGGAVVFRSLQAVVPLQAEVPVMLSKAQTIGGAALVALGIICLIIMSILFKPVPAEESSNSLSEAYADAALAGQAVTLRTLQQTLMEETTVMHEETKNYSGVCSEKGKAAALIVALKSVSSDGLVDCMAAEDSYAFEVVLRNGDFLCLDSNGTFGTFYTPRVAPELCNTPLQ